MSHTTVDSVLQSNAGRGLDIPFRSSVDPTLTLMNQGALPRHP